MSMKTVVDTFHELWILCVRYIAIKMGHRDITALHKIYEEAKLICKENELPYHFTVDDGDYETAIEFFFLGDAKTPQWETFHPPYSQNWNENSNILCPDILDYHHKIIIEFEEEVGEPRTGARLAKKGHHREGDMDNSHDTEREYYYKWGQFHTLRIWDSDTMWKGKLKKFLIDVYGN